MSDADLLLRLAVAALGGLAVGIEREWSGRAPDEPERFGGVRTFLLLGLVGGLAAVLAEEGSLAAGVTILAAGALVVAIAYFATAWRGVIDATTEVAGVVVLAAGATAGTGRLALASAVYAGTALVLVEKSKMHAAVDRIRSEELEAAARFAVLALVVLPLLPAEAIGWLGGVEPRRLWGLVLIFAGLSFVGYLALRIAGPGRGYGVAGLLGGLVSSTAVTLSFARTSREPGAAPAALARGALAASTILPLRVAVLVLVLHRPTAVALAPAIALPLLFGIGVVGWTLRAARHEEVPDEPELPRNPLRLGAAIQMTAMFALALTLFSLVRERFGTQGMMSGAALLGLAELDALTFAMGRLAARGAPAAEAAHALVVGMLANTLFKAGVAAAVGERRFRMIAVGGLLVYALLFGAALLLARA